MDAPGSDAGAHSLSNPFASAEETAAVLAELDGRRRLMGELLYGSGMRIIELVRLRVKDVDFARRMITVRDGKGRGRHEPLLLCAPSSMFPRYGFQGPQRRYHHLEGLP